MTLRAQGGGGLGGGGNREGLNDEVVDFDGRSRALRLLGDDFEGQGVIALDQSKGQRGDAGRRTVLDGQGEPLLGVAPQVEVRISPGVELG